MQNKSNKNKVKVRLDKNLLPIEYDIKLHPDLENFTFSGVEVITLSVASPIKKPGCSGSGNATLMY